VSYRESSSDDDDGAEDGKLTQQSITSMKGILKHNPSLKDGPAAKKPKLMTEAQATSSEDPQGTSLLPEYSSVAEGSDSMLRRVVMARIENLNAILDMDVVATIIPPSFTGSDFLEITAVTGKDQSAFKKGMSQIERRSLARKRVQQSSSRQLYSQSLNNLIARTDIRKFKDDDNHWIKESEMMRKQLFNAMVSQYSSALILLGVVNVDETVISKDLQKKIHKIDRH
jgi:hypothetical protein